MYSTNTSSVSTVWARTGAGANRDANRAAQNVRAGSAGEGERKRTETGFMDTCGRKKPFRGTPGRHGFSGGQGTKAWGWEARGRDSVPADPALVTACQPH